MIRRSQRKQQSNSHRHHGQHGDGPAGQVAFLHFLHFFNRDQFLQPKELLFMDLHGLLHLLPEVGRSFPDLLFVLLCLDDFDVDWVDLFVVVGTEGCHGVLAVGATVSPVVLVALSVGKPADAKFIRCEFGEETRSYFCDFFFVDVVDLDQYFHGLFGEYFCGGGVHFVMGGVIAFDFEADAVGIAIIPQYQVAIAEGVGVRLVIIESNGLISLLSDKFEAGAGIEDVFLDEAFEEGGFFGGEEFAVCFGLLEMGH
jgi:hypothetical protein